MTPEGNIFQIRTSGKPVFDDQGQFKGYRGTGSDITEPFKMSQQIAYQASHDSLTGLVNRREFETRLIRTQKSTEKNNSEHALCYLDLESV